MLKKYEKPKILMMNLVGNEQLCGSCADQRATCISKDPTVNSMLSFILEGSEGDGVLTRDEYDSYHPFGSGEECGYTVDAYCKFTSSGRLVAWS